MSEEEQGDRFMSAVAYGFGWLSAIYFINVPRRTVRWHALQSIVVFGGLMLSLIAVDAVFPVDNPSTYPLHVLLMEALLAISILLWILLPLQTYRGKPFVVPVFAPLTKKIAGEPPWLHPDDVWEPPTAPPDTSRPPAVPPASSSGTQWVPCGNCGRTGKITCPQCNGRGSWWDQPTTATGSPVLQTCAYCGGSRQVVCPVCSGTGQTQALL